MPPIINRIFSILLLLCIYQNTNAQLSSTHYLPPIYSSTETSKDGLRSQSIYLSTPSTTPIDVNIQSADGVLLNINITISSTSGGVFDLNDYYNDNDLSNNGTFVGIRGNKLNTVLDKEGLFFTASAPFLVSYRVVSDSQGDILSTKGEFAGGTRFKLGALPLSVNDLNTTPNRNIFASIMALEDDTDITIDGYDPSVLFKMSNGTYQTIPPPMVISLDARESYVIAADRNGDAVTGLNAGVINSLIGASITSNNPIVINSGNLTLSGSVTNSAGSRDFGLDQAVPVQYLGNKYAFIKGNSTGSNKINDHERPLIISTADSTDIYINGIFNIRLQEGEYLDVPGSNYSTDGTMLIEATNRVYAYQALSGNNRPNGLGMNFIPPLNCFLQREVNFIPSIDQLHPDYSMTSFINVITYTGSVVTITQDGGTPDIIPVSNAKPIPGTPDWVAYSISGYSGDVKVESTGPTMISLFGQNNDIGAAGYFSGFGGNPQIEILTVTNGIEACYYNLAISQIPENTTDYYWVRTFDNQIVSKDSLFTPLYCGNYELHVFNGSCKDVISTFVDCEPISCFPTTDDDGDGVWVTLDQDDDNDGILDAIECPDLDVVTNGNFINSSDWSTSGNWNITGGAAVNNGTNENNTILQQNVSNIEDACFDQLLLSFDIRMNSTPITSTDTARLIVELAGIPLIKITNPNGDSIAIIKRLQSFVILNQAAFDINAPSDPSYANIQLQVDWAGQPIAGNLTFKFSNDGDPIAMDNISLTLQDCTIDFDGDGIPDCQDTDSDNDGCLDALEGDGGFTYSNIQGDTLTGGVDSVGIPLIALGGQGLGSSLDPLVQAFTCSECHFDHPDYLDSDGDNIGNACDLDADNDGISNDIECPLGTGLAANPFKSLSAAFLAPSSGRYYFDLGSGVFQANVDMSEGGGWVQVLQYHHLGGTNPNLSILDAGDDLPISNNSILGTDLSLSSKNWGHLGNSGMSDMSGMDEIRWFAETSNHARVIHFKSSVGISYAQTGTGSFNGIETGFTLLSGHSANLPAAAANEYSNRGDLALTRFPFWLGGTYHWGIKANDTRWEVDDYPNDFSESTIHKVWVRNATGSTLSCDADNDGVADYLDLDSDNDGIWDATEAGHGEPSTNGKLTGAVGTNGIIDAVETSADNGISNYSISDSDSDGVDDYLDLDADNDGIWDATEAGHGEPLTSGRLTGTVGANGIIDAIETSADNGILNYVLSNSDSDGIFDYIELDSDDDGCDDVVEAGYTDNNSDGILGTNPVTVADNGVVTSGTDGYTTPDDEDGNLVYDFQENGPGPVVTTQDITVNLDITGNVTITPAMIDDGTYDNCGIQSLALDITSFNCSNLSTKEIVILKSDNTWMESTVVTPEVPGSSNPWSGITSGDLPATNTYTIIPTISSTAVTPIAGTDEIYTGSDIRYFRKTFDLNTNLDMIVTMLASVDNNIQIFINGNEVALEDDLSAANFNDGIHNRLHMVEGGSNSTGGVGFQNFDDFTILPPSSIFVAGTNEIILAVRNLAGSDTGGFSFHANIEAGTSVSNTVTLTATDNSGNTSTGTATVIVESIFSCEDSDNDGVLNSVDLDDDNDGILDLVEQNCGVVPPGSIGVPMEVTGGTPVTSIYTNFGDFWESSVGANSSIFPNTSHDLLAFTTGGVTYSTGVADDDVYDTNGNSLYELIDTNNDGVGDLTAFEMKWQAFYNTNEVSNRISLEGSLNDGDLSTALGLTVVDNPATDPLNPLLNNGVQGLDLGTGIANINESWYYNVDIISAESVGDGVPDILLTQVASPSGSTFQVITFYDASWNPIGDAVRVESTGSGGIAPQVGTYRLDLYNGNGSIFGTNQTRPIRMSSLELAEFGVDDSNVGLIVFMSIDFSSSADVAFIAYNTNTFTGLCADLDTDNDGIPDRLDVDSDNDGCADAIEGAGNFNINNLNSNNELDGLVDLNGVPVIASGGQETTTDVLDESENSQCACTIIRTNRHISRTIKK